MPSSLEAGLAAAKRHAWQESYDQLSRAIADGQDGRDVLAALADTCWWLQRHEECARLRERAYRAYSGAGDWERAADLALKLAGDYRNSLSQPIVGAGWRQRAEDLLADKPPSVVHARMALGRAQRLQATDLGGALAEVDRGIELARRFADHDEEMLGVCLKGAILMGLGRIEEGCGLQDAALTAAVAGELGAKATILVYCWLIAACERLGDINRAAEWSDAAIRYCQQSSINGFPGVCRLHRTRMLRLRGAWSEAEAEARLAFDAIRPSNAGMAGAALAEIAELRRRRGDVEGAWELAQEAMALGSGVESIFARIVADREGPEAGLYRAERLLREITGDPYFRVFVIPVYVELAIAAGTPEIAEARVAELEESARLAGTDVLGGFAASARGRLLLARGDAVAARSSLERAITSWKAANVPYEEARDRIELARALVSLGDRAGALTEAREALAALERLGATPEANRARDVVSQAEGPSLARTARALMFTDLVGSTALVEAIGDSAWRDLAAWTETTQRRCFAEYGGHEVDHAGDGFFVAFDSATLALECAESVQRFLHEHRRTQGYAPQLRIGIHVGEVIVEGDALRGAAVHRASRICALAQGDEILASREALEAAGRRAAVHGVRVKGVPDDIQVAAVDWGKPTADVAKD